MSGSPLIWTSSHLLCPFGASWPLSPLVCVAPFCLCVSPLVCLLASHLLCAWPLLVPCCESFPRSFSLRAVSRTSLPSLRSPRSMGRRLSVPLSCRSPAPCLRQTSDLHQVSRVHFTMTERSARKRGGDVSKFVLFCFCFRNRTFFFNISYWFCFG
jgi:hypothetical protein